MLLASCGRLPDSHGSEHDVLAMPAEVGVVAERPGSASDGSDRPVVLEPPGEEVALDRPGEVADRPSA